MKQIFYERQANFNINKVRLNVRFFKLILLDQNDSKEFDLLRFFNQSFAYHCIQRFFELMIYRYSYQ